MNETKEFSHESIRFAGVMLQKAVTMCNQLDMQANVFVGLNVAFLGILFALGVKNTEGIKLYELLPQFIFIVSLVLSVFSIHPPSFFSKRGNEKQSLFYNKTVRAYDQISYLNEVEQIALSEKRMLEQFSLEIYNMYKYYYTPKRKFLNHAKNIFVIAVISQFVIIGINLFR